MTDIFTALAAPFPPDAIHWRAQTVKADGTSAMALAYIDARDVMDRLDEVMTPAGWRDSLIETPKGRIICTIELKIDGEWVGKTDGAGETDVEGEKGALSDALKRTAVKWGIGRYLYALPATWADCETYEKNGKKHWKKWTAAGLQKLAKVAGGSNALARAGNDTSVDIQGMIDAVYKIDTQPLLQRWWIANQGSLSEANAEHVLEAVNKRLEQIKLMDRSRAA